MSRLCYFTVLLLVFRVNARPYELSDLSDEPNPLESVGKSRENPVPLSNQFDRSDIDRSLLDDRAERLILNGYNSAPLEDTEQEAKADAYQNADVFELESRQKRSDHDDAELDADIKRYQDILTETGKSLENDESEKLTDDDRHDDDVESSERVKRSAFDDSLDDTADDEEEDEREEDNDDAKEEDRDDAANEESDEMAEEESEAKEGEADGEADEDEEVGANEDADCSSLDSVDADIAETEDNADEQDAEEKEEDADEGSVEAENEKESNLEGSLDEVKSLDEYLGDLNAQTDQLTQLRDDLGSMLKVESSPEETARSRRQTFKLKRLAQESPVDYLKSLPQYKDVPRQVLTNAVQSLLKSGDADEDKKAAAAPAAAAAAPVEETPREPQPKERQASARVAKADEGSRPAAPCPPGGGDELKEPKTKEEEELDKVIDMRKAEEAVVAKEQDDVIKAEHLAHTMQEDLHDVMREIRALKVEINAERKDAEKVSVETKEAQQDLEMHDERKYKARRKVDELYMRLTDLESDTCDNRNKRRALKRFVNAEHYGQAARRRRMLKGKDKKDHREVARAAGDAAKVQERDSATQQGTDETHEVPKAVDGAPAVARQAQPCGQESAAKSASKKKDDEYNNILQEIIIGEAQVKVEDVQVARAEEEAVSLHRRLSNVLSKLAALSIEMKNLQTQAQVSGKRAKQAQAELAYHDQILFTARKKVNAARNLESDLQQAITDKRMNVKGNCSSTKCPCPSAKR